MKKSSSKNIRKRIYKKKVIDKKNIKRVKKSNIKHTKKGTANSIKKKVPVYKQNTQNEKYFENRPKTQIRRSDFRGNRVLAVIIFLFLMIYLLGYLIVFINRPSIPIETVSYGTIDAPAVLKGIIVRDEEVVKSTMAGKPTYYFSENEKIKKDVVVCSIKNEDTSNAIETKIAKIDKDILNIQKNRSDISIFQDDIQRIEKNIKNTVDAYTYKFANGNVSNVYLLKNQIESQINQRNQIWMTENTESLSGLSQERNQYQTQLNENMTSIATQNSGILSFKVDNMEDKLNPDSLSQITKEQTTMKFPMETISKSQSVEADTPVFKVVKSNIWYLVSYIPIDIMSEWEEGDTKILYAVLEEEEKSVSVKIESIEMLDKEAKVIFQTDRNLIDFIEERTIEFQVKDEIYQGIKIPNSAIVEKTLLKIPSDCIIENLGQTGVIKVVNGVGTFVQQKIAKNDTQEGFAYILQDFQSLNVGDIILKGTGENATQYTVNEIETDKGVYVVNSSIAEFTIIEIMGQNKDYSVVKPGMASYELQVYDNIVSDAKNVQESEEIF